MYVYSLSFADDQAVLAQDRDDVEYMARKLKEEYEEWGLTINLEKNEIYMCTGEGKESLKLEGGEEIRPCTECTYLGKRGSTSSHGNKELGTRSMEKQKGMKFGL